MASSENLAIRSFRDGDEKVLARMFSAWTLGFFGPGPVTAESWRDQFRRQGWNAPSLDADKECGRVAEREGKIIGYAITDYQPFYMPNGALIQELCVAEVEDAQEVAQALIEDAEGRARERGKTHIAIQLPEEGGLVSAAAAAGEYEAPSESDEVFMAIITNVERFLDEIREELGRRIGESDLQDWRGTVRIVSGEQAATLHIESGTVSVAPDSETTDVCAVVDPEALPLLLMGRRRAGDLYRHNDLSVGGSDEIDALRMMEVLFPLMPMYLPRAQWW